MEPLVSIIVPVYNLEGYVTNCLNSLVNQTYGNLEILCIDDGSTDKSADVIKAFAEKDDRVIYLYKENGGVSSARNMGLDMFKGEYVMFVDGDDYLHPQAVDLFIKAKIKSNCDLVCSNYKQVDVLDFPSGDILNSKNIVCSKIEFFKTVSDMVCRTVWCKFFTRKLAKQFRFPYDVTNGEDTVYLFMILNQCDSVAYIDDQLYFYYSRRGSASKTEFKYSAVTMLDGLSGLCDYLNNKQSLYLLSQSLCMLYKAMFSNRTLSIGTEYENFVSKKCRLLGDKWLKCFLTSKYVDMSDKIVFLVFFHSRHLYELARLIQDPTMLDFYKNRRKHNGKSQKD